MSAEGSWRKPKEAEGSRRKLKGSWRNGSWRKLKEAEGSRGKPRQAEGSWRKLKEAEGNKQNDAQGSWKRQKQKRTEGTRRKLKKGSEKLKEVQKKTEGSIGKRWEAEGSWILKKSSPLSVLQAALSSERALAASEILHVRSEIWDRRALAPEIWHPRTFG